jgi:hypothetical protein
VVNSSQPKMLYSTAKNRRRSQATERGNHRHFSEKQKDDMGGVVRREKSLN